MPTMAIPGAEIHFVHSGAGEPLLLIPGLGLDHGYYRRALPFLEREFSVTAVDPRGVGGSSKGPGPYTVESWADDLAALINAFARGPMHVLGSSLGGAMALALAARHPHTLQSLIVVGAFSELDRAARLNFLLRVRLIEKLGLSEEVADYMGLWTMTRAFINSEEGYAQMRANQQIIRKNSAELYLAFVRSVLAWDRALPGQESEPKFTVALQGIRVPTLVVCSDNDQLIPLESSRIIAREIPGARLIVMPGAGHIPFIERPREAAGIVVEFIQSKAERR
jgi:pimeloyl-ACP methyl ester carboxylesterase